MIVHWSFILYIVPILVQSQTIPQCFQDARNASSIICKNEDLTRVNRTVYRSLGIAETKIKTVRLTNCTIANLDFLNSPYLREVTVLNLNGTAGLSDNHLSSLVNVSLKLENLTISNHPTLKSIDGLIPRDPNGDHWDNLKICRVISNAIDTIDPRLFRSMNKVNEFDLSFNRLHELNLGQHNVITAVRKLLLRGNLLQRITNLQFDSLEEVDLADNRLDAIDFVPTILSSATLKNLDLSRNIISNFSLPNVNQLPNNEFTVPLTINLGQNTLTGIGDLGRSMAKRVEVLNLGQNGNLQITETTFKDLPNLKTLKLHQCGIVEITTHLQNLPKLAHLNLNGNRIFELPNETFVGSVEIEEIRIRDNYLAKLDFLTTRSVQLQKLRKIDVSLNRLENLENFVSAPNLTELRMDGTYNLNKLRQLSLCGSFTELPSTLKIVCARNIQERTINNCSYNLFLDLLKNQKVIYNNEDCCDRKTCEMSSPSNYPIERQCPAKEDLCAMVPVVSGRTSVEPITRATCVAPKRDSFQDLHDSEKILMVIGYILAFIFLVMVTIMFRRRYRSYDKWLQDYHTESNGHQTSSPPCHSRSGVDTLDTVDGKFEVLNPRSGAYGTLQRQKTQGKSFDNISMASGITQYSTGKSPFVGRKRFKDANSLDDEKQSLRYNNPMQRPQLNSGAESPTEMSVYSYASYQPTKQKLGHSETPSMERKRHRSGGAIESLPSNDLLQELLNVDEDIMLPHVRIGFQRKATDKKKQLKNSSLARNASACGAFSHRNGANHGIWPKRSHSPMIVNGIPRNASAPSLTALNRKKRALPDIPHGSLGSIDLSSSSISSSFVAADETEYYETDQTTWQNRSHRW